MRLYFILHSQNRIYLIVGLARDDKVSLEEDIPKQHLAPVNIPFCQRALWQFSMAAFVFFPCHA